jgi:shikimate kinase
MKERFTVSTKRIILIGMTGCGKSTVGKKLSEISALSFLDLDEMITKGENKTPRELFDLYGEEHFRDLEHRYLLKALEREEMILSCGGGVVLREENRRALEKENVVWILRSPEAVLSSPAVLNRPPVNGDPENYRALYKKRKKLYSSCAKVTIFNTDSGVCAKDLAKLYGFIK